MHWKTTMKVALLAVLCALLLGAPAMAAGRWVPASQRGVGSAPGVFGAEALAFRSWFWVLSFLADDRVCFDSGGGCGTILPAGSQVPTKTGMCIDPNGQCATSSSGGAPGSTGNGLCTDPDGLGCLMVAPGG